METNPWQIPYPMENWKMRYMVVWIQNQDKFIVQIWKTLDMRFGCKIRINSLHSITTIIGNIHFYFDLTKGYFQYGRTDSGAENYWSCNREIPKGAWTFGVLSVTSIWIKDITLLKKKENYRLLWGQAHYDVTDKNNNISLECLDICYHCYHYYHSSSYGLKVILEIMSCSTFKTAVIIGL